MIHIPQLKGLQKGVIFANQECLDLPNLPIGAIQSGQISIIPKPELRRFWGDSHTFHHHEKGDRSGSLVVII